MPFLRVSEGSVVGWRPTVYALIMPLSIHDASVMLGRVSGTMTSQVPPEHPTSRSTLARVVAAMTRPHVLALLAIIVLAIGLRVAWIAYVNPNPERRPDGRHRLLRQGRACRSARQPGYTNFYGFPTAQWPPAYPFLLAGIYKAFGHNIIVPKVANALAGGLTCLLIYLIAARVFNRRVGLLGAFLFAIFPGAVVLVDAADDGVADAGPSLPDAAAYS